MPYLELSFGGEMLDSRNGINREINKKIACLNLCVMSGHCHFLCSIWL